MIKTSSSRDSVHLLVPLHFAYSFKQNFNSKLKTPQGYHITCQLVITTVSARFLSTPFDSKNRMNVVAYEQSYTFKQIQIQIILVFQPFPPKCFQAVVSRGETLSLSNNYFHGPQVAPSPADKPKLLKDEG